MRRGEKLGHQWGETMAASGRNRGRGELPVVCQAVLMVQWLWSFSRLCVAVTNRNSDCPADLPLRMNRSMCRLYLICPRRATTTTSIRSTLRTRSKRSSGDHGSRCRKTDPQEPLPAGNRPVTQKPARMALTITPFVADLRPRGSAVTEAATPNRQPWRALAAQGAARAVTAATARRVRWQPPAPPGAGRGRAGRGASTRASTSSRRPAGA
jgi:hypothetical protein